MQFEVGQRAGDYEIVQILGAGGMGKVYKVRNTISDRVEAMKVLLPEIVNDAELADRFLREIKVQAALTHPNIASLHTAQRLDDQLLMLMEFVEGRSISELLANGPIPLDKAVDYIAQVLLALGYAHSQGVIHRDIKPANIMVTPTGLVKLMDFGIARMKADKRLTQTGRTVGSLYYMSPEQIRGEREPDLRSDIYSLGITLYEMVTGKKPFDASTDFSIMSAHLTQTPHPPIQVSPFVTPQLSEIIMMAMAKDPAGRFQSAEAFRNALLSGSGKTVIQTDRASAPPPPPVGVAPPPIPSSVSALPPSTVPSKSYRGLYMALGSLVTIGVLVTAAIQIPKWREANAQEKKSDPSGYTPAVPLSQVPSSSGSSSGAAVPSPTPAPQVVDVGTPSPTPSPVPVMQGNTKPEVSKPTPVAQGRPTPAPPAVPSQQPQQTTVVQQQVPAQQTPLQQPQVQQPPAVSQPIVNTAELAGLREQMMLLATRVAAIQTKAKRIEAQQQSQGLGMRTDVVSGISRMTFFMDEVENALNNKNASGAKSALQKAEGITENLERILGI